MGLVALQQRYRRLFFIQAMPTQLVRTAQAERLRQNSSSRLLILIGFSVFQSLFGWVLSQARSAWKTVESKKTRAAKSVDDIRRPADKLNHTRSQRDSESAITPA